MRKKNQEKAKNNFRKKTAEKKSLINSPKQIEEITWKKIS